MQMCDQKLCDSIIHIFFPMFFRSEWTRIIDRWAAVFLVARGHGNRDNRADQNLRTSALLLHLACGGVGCDDRVSIYRQPDIIIQDIKYYCRRGAISIHDHDYPPCCQ